MSRKYKGAHDPLYYYYDQPVLLIYRAHTSISSLFNVMTNGAWTWYYKDEKNKGTIHEFSNHGSFTSAAAQRELITHMSMVFLRPTKENVELLKTCGSLSGHTHREDKMELVRSLLPGEIKNGFYVPNDVPTWCVRPFDFHRVPSLFTIVSTRFVAAYGGYPVKRIIDEHGLFWSLEKGTIPRL
jgi:hypothetical protein